MRDLVFLLVVAAFFAVATAYVHACGVLAGDGEDVAPDIGSPARTRQTTAGRPTTATGPTTPGR